MRKNFKSQTLLVSIPTIVFIILSAASQITSAIGLSSITKTLQAISLLSLLFFLAKKIPNRKHRSITLYLLFLIIYLFVNLISSLFNQVDTTPTLIFIGFAQIFFLYFWILVFEFSNFSTIDRIMRITAKFTLILIMISGLEFFIPQNYKLAGLTYILKGDIPGSYFSRDLNFLSSNLRLGSLFLSPLTFAYSCIFLLVYSLTKGQKKESITSVIFSILSQVKTSIIGATIFLVSPFIRKISKIVFVLVIAIIFAICFYFDGADFLHTKDDSPFKSLSNHFVGLVAGIHTGILNMFTGKGLGTSGFLVYTTIISDNINITPFAPESPFLNGNESTFGVIAYQLGFVFLLLHIGLIYHYLKNFSKAKSGASCCFLFFLIVFQISSESPLTLYISITSALAIVWLKKHHQQSKIIQQTNQPNFEGRREC